MTLGRASLAPAMETNGIKVRGAVDSALLGSFGVSSNENSRTSRHLLPATVVLALAILGGAALLNIPAARQSRQVTDQVTRLTAEVSRLSQEQAMPSVVMARHRDSICYIYALYTLTPPGGRWEHPARTRVSGTGFVVANGLVATNRHVVEPWYDDEQDQAMIQRGAVPRLEKLVAFFPGLPDPVELTNVQISTAHDLAVAHFATTPKMSAQRPLPLAGANAVPGDAVVVVGYPMGVTAMLAKSPRKVYKRLAYTHETIDIARDLASHSLIRPSATYGHLGDVVEDKLIYDAPTAQGGSGGPVFNSRGQVIGVTAAYIDGFAGGTLGVSVQALKPLIAIAQKSTHASQLTNPVPAQPGADEASTDAAGGGDFDVPAGGDDLPW
ncbi:MAG: S1 family peptidase [Terriglobales bacterium]